MHLFSQLRLSLGPANPQPNTVLVETLPTSDIKDLIWIFATTTKICTKGHFNPTSPRVFCVTFASTYSLRFGVYRKGQASTLHFSAIHFRGRSIRQVSCYTLLSGCRLPWPPSCCLYELTPFVVSFNVNFGVLSWRSVHPASPVLLTRNGPLSTCHFAQVSN